MSEPIGLSKKAYVAFEGERWNAFIDLLSTARPDETTPVQRVAFRAWVYSSEVLNGGHEQYFGNQQDLNHVEVIDNLKTLGAHCQSDVLASAFSFESMAQTSMPEGYEAYVSWDEEYGYSEKLRVFDLDFYRCRPEIETELLQRYLDVNESEFIKWKP